MREYDRLKGWIAKGRTKHDRPLANNTRIIDRGDSVAIRLHATDVVTYHENGDVSFNSGGWRTVTTKDRMGYAGEFSIYSDGGTWYIYHRDRAARIERNLRRKFDLPVSLAEWPEDNYAYENCYGMIHLGYVGARSRGYGFWLEMAEKIGHKDAYRIYRAFESELHERTRYLFFDGIRFTQRGRCVNAIPVAEAERKIKADERLRKRVREYAKLAVKVLDEGPIPVQNSGDCWYCLMRTADEDKPDARDEGGQLSYGYRFQHMRGQNLGDSLNDHTHLREHMSEGYVPSALLLSAMDEQPYASIIGKQMHLGIHQNDEGEYVMGGVAEYAYGMRRRHSADRVAKAVYEFVARRLLPGRELRGNFGAGQGSTFPEPQVKSAT